MSIHESQTPTQGHSSGYKVVSRIWLNAMTAVAIINFLVVMGLTATLIDVLHAVDKSTEFNEITRQRHRATDEMLQRRARIQQWNFQNVCVMMQERNQPCLDNPQWWADPSRYPLLQNEYRSGSGLFPTYTEQNQ